MNATSQCNMQSVGPATQLMTMLMTSLMSQQCGVMPTYPTDQGPSMIKNGCDEIFDFVIVGAGSAGSILANRLTENPNINVLLLEAGTTPPIETEIPLFFFYLQDPSTDFSYFAEPSKIASLGMNNNVTFLPSAKMLGGSSSQNTMLYLRGNDRDYNNWALQGNFGWDFESVLPFFKKSESNRVSSCMYDGYHHSRVGEIPVENFNFTGRELTTVESIFAELGFIQLQDFNGYQFLGYGSAQGTVSNGTRVNTAKAFLIPIANRTNLKIVQNAQVTHLDFDYFNRVSGVNFMINGNTPMRAGVRKEAIISAGSFNSPLILLNSGIGPAPHLKEMNVGLTCDSPVGHNLQDHFMVMYPMTFFSTPEVDSNQDQATFFYDYLQTRDAKFSNVKLIEFTAFINTQSQTTFSLYPDIQIQGVSLVENAPILPFILEKFNYVDQITNALLSANANSNMIFYFIVLLNPVSRGTVKLASNNPMVKAKINPNYLSAQSDVNTLIRGIRSMQKSNTTQAFIQNDGKAFRIPLPACDTLAFDSDKYWECYIRHIGTSFSHPVGTNKMGPLFDPTSVVDPTLSVKGVEGVRVVDSSIMPEIVSANSNAVTFMIAEKGASLIKEFWDC